MFPIVDMCIKELSHCGLVMPYSDIIWVNIGLDYDLFAAWWHQAITWTDVDLSSNAIICDIHT